LQHLAAYREDKSLNRDIASRCIQHAPGSQHPYWSVALTKSLACKVIVIELGLEVEEVEVVVVVCCCVVMVVVVVVVVVMRCR
jgi:hypothetical protein